ncbi:mucin-17 [Fukomys damarensis]|uniref:Mucin-17 n=1 Tax=Fukomys damarensis TaxID=885580 RepID=A0A091DYA1_FUKDA|nr:mucin-17 [Fukomys damarensis]KFO35453.1 Mucin-17 [Fukomys damarensis]
MPLLSSSVTPPIVSRSTIVHPTLSAHISTVRPMSSSPPLTTVMLATTSTPTAMASTTTARSCLNGGLWTGEACVCPSGFTGDRCQFESNVCSNGGSWNGLECQCSPFFFGPKCEEVIDGTKLDLPQKASASVKLTVTVTSQQYRDKLEDQSSEEFKNFNTIFTEQMKLIYAGIPEYEGVNIMSLRPGSVVVEHEVILKANYSLEYKQVLEKASQQVKEKILNATKKQISSSNGTCSAYLLCFNSTATVIQNVSIVQYDPERECREMAGAYAAHFTVQYKDQQPYCITPCMPGFNTSLDCHYGKCQLQLRGPRCNCLITDTHWYQGETCERGIQKSLVYGLSGAGAAVVLVVLVVLLVFALHAKRVAAREKYRVSQLYKWYEEGGAPAPGTFENTGFAICDEQEHYVQLDSIYHNFQPSLNNVDSKTKIKIQKPQVIMTSM